MVRSLCMLHCMLSHVCMMYVPRVSLPMFHDLHSCFPGLSPDLQSLEQIRRIMRPTDVPDQGNYLFEICTVMLYTW